MSQAPEDDERTIVRPSSGKGGQREASVQPGHTLPTGTRIRDYEITSLIGEGGFGIVYLAYDHSLQRSVAIKEYMPSSMASRVNASATVIVKSARHEETFKAGLKSFVNEARLLARFDHPALVKVYRFWEENGTAYMVMPFYEGPTLKSALAMLGKPPDEAALRAWLQPLLDALGVMHAAQCYHRDIAPDNILLTATGPLLLDFGAARRVIGDMTHALTVVLKPGYAPIEQYGDVATMAQGAWTDLYALACVVYFAITGKVPMSSVERLMDDRLEPLTRLVAGRYSPGLLRAVDAALAVRPQDRPQTDAQFRAMFDPPGAAARNAPPASASAPRAAPVAPPVRTTPPARPPPPAPAPSSAAPSPSFLTPSLAPIPGVERTLPRTAPPPVSRTSAMQAEAETAAPAPVTLPRAEPEPFLRGAVPAAAPPIAPTTARGAHPARRRTAALPAAGAAVCAIAVATAAWYFLGNRNPDSPQRVATPASSPTGPEPSAASVSLPPPAVSEAPAPAPAIDPAAVQPRPAIAPSRSVPPPATETPTATPAAKAPVPEPTPARPRREPPARVEAAPPTPRIVPPRDADVSSRCSDILQKASLEPLTAGEAAFLKRECR